VEGYTNDVTLSELKEISDRHEIPIIDDLGSGCLLDVTEYGLAEEPTVQGSVSLGAGLTCFSGDKLIGGPQAGIIVGKKELVEKLKRHTLVRAIRIDKVRLAGLTATLIHYLKGEATKEIPIWRMISMPIDDIERRCQAWVKPFKGLIKVIDGESMVGGGSLPGSTLPTKLAAIDGQKSTKGPSFAQAAAALLRQHYPPVIGRISDDVLLLDPRTVFPEEDNDVLSALTAALDKVRKS
jgi:L-seryl-tRNA(Ser) seleniumtransferase